MDVDDRTDARQLERFDGRRPDDALRRRRRRQSGRIEDRLDQPQLARRRRRRRRLPPRLDDPGGRLVGHLAAGRGEAYPLVGGRLAAGGGDDAGVRLASLEGRRGCRGGGGCVNVDGPVRGRGRRSDVSDVDGAEFGEHPFEASVVGRHQRLLAGQRRYMLYGVLQNGRLKRNIYLFIYYSVKKQHTRKLKPK